MAKTTHKALFHKYRDDTVLQKARKYAHWTLPQLMADVTLAARGATIVLERDYQEIGALLVNNLASKLAGLLFPSSRPFYKIKPSKELTKLAKEKGIQEASMAGNMAKLEMESCQQLFLNGSYEQLVMSMKHLIVTGNVLMYRDTKLNKSTVYGLTSYSIRRDGRGNLMDCLLQEFADIKTLPLDVQSVLRLKSPHKYREGSDSSHNVELYTRIERDSDSNGNPIYKVTQQADGLDVGTPGSYPEHLCPWQAVSWSLIAGENYGRGLVEDYAGGFAKLSDESLAATLYGVEACRLINLVAPGMGADVDELQAAGTGEYVQGSKDSVLAHEGGDAGKMQQMAASIEATFGRLARAFMYKANTRNAERVTAFELKQDALEAEETLGGTYSSLSAAMQVPLAHVLLTEVDSAMQGAILLGHIKLGIMAGIQALGRQAEVQNLAMAAQDAAAIIPVLAQLSNRVDKDKVLDVIMAGQSVDTSTIYKDEKQLAAEKDAAQQQAAGQAQIAQSTTLADQSALAQQITG